MTFSINKTVLPCNNLKAGPEIKGSSGLNSTKLNHFKEKIVSFILKKPFKNWT
jgi:hypothetical protein